MSEKNLTAWLHKNLPVGLNACDESINELAEDTRLALQRYFQGPPRKRPSRVDRELDSLAKHLDKAAAAAGRAGDEGLARMAIASGGRVPEQADMRGHVLYLERLARISRQGAQVAVKHSKSMQDDHGGRTPDGNLRALVVHLMIGYGSYLGIKLTHTVDPETGLAPRGVAAFVKEALRLFAPEGIAFEPRLIDEIVRENLSVRDLELLDPLSFETTGQE